MNNQNIENFMKLATNRKGGTGESPQDQYYRQTYNALSTGKKVRWNWGACLGIYWLVYRKMYLAGTVLGLIFCLLRLFMELRGINPLLLLPLLASLSMVSGLFGNWFYIRHIHKKIDKGHHLCDRENIDKIRPIVLLFAIPRMFR
jgi:hypothetical protein